MNEQIFVLANQKKNTNHILHLILSLLTGGLWLIVWVIVAVSNSRHNSRIQGRMNHVLSYKVQGCSDVEAYENVQKDVQKDRANKRNALIAIALVIVVYLLIRPWL